MKKIKKLNLKDASVMTDSEMKIVTGGYGGSCDPNAGIRCSGTCYHGGFQGTCKNEAIGSVWDPLVFKCACVIG